MQKIDRIFGSSPRIHLTMLSLAVVVYFLRIEYPWTQLSRMAGSHLTLGFLMLVLWGIVGLWSLNSLGRKIGLALMRSGPYAFVRHPMYTSEILFGWLAVMCILNTWLALLAMVITFFLANHLVRYEEELMEQHFHEAWRAYAKETPRFFPFLKKTHHTKPISDSRVM